MNNNTPHIAPYRGRFAPSPTGPLHFGSLVAAVGSYLDAKYHHGQWLVRIEDIDTPRTVSGTADAILRTLDALGMEWDESVVYQSRRTDIYQEALHELTRQGLLYPCTCSRKEIADSSIVGINGPIYPGTCRHNPLAQEKPYALRILTNDETIEFQDRVTGSYSQQLVRDIGDFVLRRADGVYAYQLAVVADDADQRITHIVRGADLLDSTPRQIYLQRLLGYPRLRYMHLPIATNAAGEKLSKQTHAASIDLDKALPQLVETLRFLGQKPPDEILEGDIAAFWSWAIQNWRADLISH